GGGIVVPGQVGVWRPVLSHQRTARADHVRVLGSALKLESADRFAPQRERIQPEGDLQVIEIDRRGRRSRTYRYRHAHGIGMIPPAGEFDMPFISDLWCAD